MAKSNDPRIQRAKPYAGVKRTMRSPNHPFSLKTRPFQIQPFLISPVLPGETLTNLVHQSRTVTKPIKDPLLGWWTEHYYFYVRLRDIEFHLGDNFLDEMVTSPGTYDHTPLRASAAAKFYHDGASTPWVKYAMETIVEYYFRDEGEDWDAASLDGIPLAQIAQRNWFDSLTLADEKRPDRDVNLDLDSDGDITAREAEEAMQIWQAQRDAGLESLDYADWIKTFGIAVPEDNTTSMNEYKPELLRYNRQWQYPVNTVDPATGTPSSAVSWLTAFAADKSRMFKEPGFIIGLQVTKPKVYLRDPQGSLAGYMEKLENWLPALSHSSYEKGFLQFAHADGPLGGKFKTDADVNQGYWLDLRDLLMYGDQFINYDYSAAPSALSVLTEDGARRYANTSQIDGLFKSAAPANVIDTDGVTALRIMGRQKDRTPGARTL